MTDGSTVAWLDDVEMAAWRSFIETVFDLTRALEADLAPSGLTLGDYQVLVFLSEAPEHALRMCDLAQLLQLSPSGLTRRLDGLTRSGDVERVPSDLDRRVMLARLTPAGMRRLQEVAPSHVDSVRRRMIDVIDDADLPVLARAFAAIRQQLESDGSRR